MDVCLSKRKRPSVRFSMILMKLSYRLSGSRNSNLGSDFRFLVVVTEKPKARVRFSVTMPIQNSEILTLDSDSSTPKTLGLTVSGFTRVFLLFPFLKERVYNTKMFVCMFVCLSERKRPSVRFSMILMKRPYRFFGSGIPNPVSDFRNSVTYLGRQVSQKSKFGLVWGKGPRIGFRGRGVTIRGAFRSRTSRSVCYPSEFSYEFNGRWKDNVLWRWDIGVKQNCTAGYVSTKIDFGILHF